jgi:hypothetical protein
MKVIRYACSPAALSVLLILAASQLAAAQKTVSFLGQPPISSGGHGATSIAIADVNGDGILDLAVSNDCTETCTSGSLGVVSILLGNGDGTFQTAVTYSSGAQATDSVAIGDVNGDGIPDLVLTSQCAANTACVSTSPGVASVLLGNGNGTFQTAVTYNTGAAVAVSVAIGDVNGDGIPDLVIANQCMLTGQTCTGAASVLLGNGGGTFKTPVIYGTGGVDANWVSIKDVNGDGIPDLVVANGSETTASGSPGGIGVLLGNGNGTFQTAVAYSSGASQAVSVAVADLNGDGIPDLSVANNCLNIGSGACTVDGGVSILLGNGNGTFQTAVAYDSGGFEATSVAVQDVNGDGVPDLAVTNTCQSVNSNGICQGTGEVSVLAGNGDGSFQPAVIFQAFQTPIEYGTGGAQADRVVIGDVNKDGKPDLAALNFCGTCASGTIRVLLNNYTAASTTTVTSSLNPAPVNTPVTFTATVTSTVTVPNGTVVNFESNLTQLGYGTTTNGVATLTTSFTNTGSFTVRATTVANGYLQGSTGATTQVINQ